MFAFIGSNGKHLKTQEAATGEDVALAELPTEVISKILSSLPVKTLLMQVRFAGAPSSNTGQFADLVLAQSLGHCDIITLICIMGNIEPSCFGRVGRRHFSLDAQTGFTTPLSQLDQTINLTVEDSQNVNDLICFDIGDLTYLCNISTREVKALPHTGPDFPIHLHRNICSFSSLGFDLVTEQHKVMRTWVLNALNHSGEVITTNKILTLGTSLSRKIGSSTIEFPLAGSVCFNRAIHFLMLDLMSNKIIVVFDVGTEKFRTTRFPDGALNRVHRPEVDTIHRPSDSVRL